MKRIAMHLILATGLAMGAVGVAQAHTHVDIGLSLGVPAYVQPALVYVQPAPVYAYGGSYANYGYRHDPHWDHAGWDHRGDRGGERWGHRG